MGVCGIEDLFLFQVILSFRPVSKYLVTCKFAESCCTRRDVAVRTVWAFKFGVDDDLNLGIKLL